MHDWVKYIVSEIEPIEDPSYGPRYRCSLTLKDGTFLPCAVIQSKQRLADLAKRRIREEMEGKGHIGGDDPYGQIVTSFVARGNKVNDDDVASADIAHFAPPLTLLREIHGETFMAWTGWVLVFSHCAPCRGDRSYPGADVERRRKWRRRDADREAANRGGVRRADCVGGLWGNANRFGQSSRATRGAHTHRCGAWRHCLGGVPAGRSRAGEAHHAVSQRRGDLHGGRSGGRGARPRYRSRHGHSRSKVTLQLDQLGRVRDPTSFCRITRFQACSARSAVAFARRPVGG
jgi:hypothetical protein